jgi:hypothetical protein
MMLDDQFSAALNDGRTLTRRLKQLTKLRRKGARPAGGIPSRVELLTMRAQVKREIAEIDVLLAANGGAPRATLAKRARHELGRFLKNEAKRNGVRFRR